MKTLSSTTLVLLLACWAPTIPAADGGGAKDRTASDQPARLVLVPSNAWFYAGPSDKAYRLRFMRRLPSMKRAYKRAIFPLYATARPKRVLTFRLAAPLPAGPGWAHLRPLDADAQTPRGCGFIAPGGGVAIDLYVHTADLLETLKEPFRAGFEEGTELQLQPGVVIRPGPKKGRNIAETPHLQVELGLAPSMLTRSFVPRPDLATAKPAAWAKGPIGLSITPGIRATLFGVDLGLQAEPVKRGHGRWLMTAASACARVMGVGRYRPMKDEPAGGLARILAKLPPDALRIAAGVPVFWPDGTAAGRTTRELTFWPGQEVRTELKGRRCAKHELFEGNDQVLCFPADRVTQPGP